jgi:glycosyltransferase involved in cell wall biosynthesis
MVTAVIPAQNEEGRILKVIKSITHSSIDRILVIVNGSRDKTFTEVLSCKNPNVQCFFFQESLGIDIPRAVGALISKRFGSDTVVFVDGDMIGNITGVIQQLIISISHQKADLALTNCYPTIPYNKGLTAETLKFRKRLNKVLGLFQAIGYSTPSHGPHAVSKKLLQQVDIKDFAVPPILLAQCVKQNMKVVVSSTIPHYQLGSKSKNVLHAQKISETIIGDCIEAINFFEGKPRERSFKGKHYEGYNPFRRWDVLSKIE